jgi:hypothetical protein
MSLRWYAIRSSSSGVLGFVASSRSTASTRSASVLFLFISIFLLDRLPDADELTVEVEQHCEDSVHVLATHDGLPEHRFIVAAARGGNKRPVGTCPVASVQP